MKKLRLLDVFLKNFIQSFKKKAISYDKIIVRNTRSKSEKAYYIKDFRIF
jgi:hypothetical protein